MTLLMHRGLMSAAISTHRCREPEAMMLAAGAYDLARSSLAYRSNATSLRVRCDATRSRGVSGGVRMAR